MRPRIGITGPARGAFGPRTCIALGVLIAGGRPVQLRPGDESAAAGMHGLIISGGHDVDPVLYAAESEVHPNYDPERDAFEGAVIRGALAAGRPLLGICRGAQLINVCLGGSLFQDLTPRRQRTSKRRTLLPLKTLMITPETCLAGLLGVRPRSINSLHNQAVDRLGRGLVVSGRDLDGIVQAVEGSAAHPFLLGVQWHPEFLLYLAPQRVLFRRLVAAARAQAERPADEAASNRQPAAGSSCVTRRT